MPTPMLIDTDMGVDDAIALALALATSRLEVVGLASVGGNVPLAQATLNIARLLEGLRVARRPPIGRGLDQDAPQLAHACHVHGADGLGDVDLPVPAEMPTVPFIELYEQAIEAHGAELAVVAIGPLTNLAAILRERPGLLQRAGRIVIMGGAIWGPGNVTPFAEFNFYRDPAAAAAVFSAGLPVTVVPLDVTTQVGLDDSHAAHLACSGTRAGELLAAMLRWPMQSAAQRGEAQGRFLIHDALAVGVLLWPELFMRAKMALDITAAGEQAGRSKPVVSKDPRRQLSVVMSVNVSDFLKNLLEQICRERFVV